MTRTIDVPDDPGARDPDAPYVLWELLRELSGAPDAAAGGAVVTRAVLDLLQVERALLFAIAAGGPGPLVASAGPPPPATLPAAARTVLARAAAADPSAEGAAGVVYSRSGERLSLLSAPAIADGTVVRVLLALTPTRRRFTDAERLRFGGLAALAALHAAAHANAPDRHRESDPERCPMCGFRLNAHGSRAAGQQTDQVPVTPAP